MLSGRIGYLGSMGTGAGEECGSRARGQLLQPDCLEQRPSAYCLPFLYLAGDHHCQGDLQATVDDPDSALSILCVLELDLKAIFFVLAVCHWLRQDVITRRSALVFCFWLRVLVSENGTPFKYTVGIPPLRLHI